MNLTEYNALPEGDTKLTVRLAITCGWQPEFVRQQFFKYVDVFDPDISWMRWRDFSPFTDPSIPYGLIGHGVAKVVQFGETFLASSHEEYVAGTGQLSFRNASKTHVIIQAFCATDPLGHWFNFIQDAE